MENLGKLVAEHCKRRNTLGRYWLRLTKEAISEARKGGIAILSSNEPLDGEVEGRIYVFRDGEYDDSSLLRLSKNNLPSLYRRYAEGVVKHRATRDELSKVYDALRRLQEDL